MSQRRSEPTRKMLHSILIFSVVIVTSVESAKAPHIVLIVGDDVGFNDVSFRGTEDIPTPNIDALAYSGRILDRHYTMPVCSPTRSSLLTGVHAVRYGMQGLPIGIGEPRGLPLNLTVLPEHLRSLNYSTHLVGKWHLGFHRWAYTPTYRGFDSFVGYYNPFVGYRSHEVQMETLDGLVQEGLPIGYDMHRDTEVAFDLRGRYMTDLLTDEAEKVIWEHDTEQPLFLELAHLATHTGHQQLEVEVSNESANNRRFGFIKDLQRRHLAGAMAALDDSVGRVVRALADRDMLSDSLIVFLSDNGAQSIGLHNTSGSNWPLRGQKFALFDGAVRTAAVVWHAGMKPASELHTDIFHISDWLPTFYEAAGGKVSDLGDLDGVSQWEKLSGDGSTPGPRTEFFVSTDDHGASAYVDNWWKLLIGPVQPLVGDFSGDEGRTPGAHPYNLCGVVNSQTAKFLAQASQNSDFERLGERAAKLRALATLPATCRNNATAELPNCTLGCLYNLRDDPCETTNLVDQYPSVFSSLLLKIREWEAKSVPSTHTFTDPNSDPGRFGGAWVPWMDVQPVTQPPNQTTTTTTETIDSGCKEISATAMLISLCVILVHLELIQT